MSHFALFLSRIAQLQTGEEQDGHASGADAIDILDRLILESRACLIAHRNADPTPAAGLAVIKTLRDNLDDAVGILPSDCGFDASIKAADDYLKLRHQTDELCPTGLDLIRSMKALIDEAISIHIYQPDDEVPADCAYHAAVDQADLYIKAQELGEG
ncbi:hypothetical protein [Brevundimonas naejangsanensis]|uniref:hypothetical protein n=1 Tax=Brevundimonas naejangsanensis TaxID=588932 RepID=UPI000EC660BC|nr:hypothetical protein [Brevundimonas naejangsanensis]HAC02075.1 hypothetical protein [Brevundimonas sp.]